jgi:hypothetical protein
MFNTIPKEAFPATSEDLEVSSGINYISSWKYILTA